MSLKSEISKVVRLERKRKPREVCDRIITWDCAYSSHLESNFIYCYESQVPTVLQMLSHPDVEAVFVNKITKIWKFDKIQNVMKEGV